MTTHNGLPPSVNADAIELPQYTAVNLVAFAETVDVGDRLRVFGQKPLTVKDIRWINRKLHVVIAFSDLDAYRGMQLRFVVTDDAGYGGVLRWTGEPTPSWKRRMTDERTRDYVVEARVNGARETSYPSVTTADVQVDRVNTKQIGRPSRKQRV